MYWSKCAKITAFLESCHISANEVLQWEWLAIMTGCRGSMSASLCGNPSKNNGCRFFMCGINVFKRKWCGFLKWDVLHFNLYTFVFLCFIEILDLRLEPYQKVKVKKYEISWWSGFLPSEHLILFGIFVFQNIFVGNLCFLGTAIFNRPCLYSSADFFS